MIKYMGEGRHLSHFKELQRVHGDSHPVPPLNCLLPTWAAIHFQRVHHGNEGVIHRWEF